MRRQLTDTTWISSAARGADSTEGALEKAPLSRAPATESQGTRTPTRAQGPPPPRREGAPRDQEQQALRGRDGSTATAAARPGGAFRCKGTRRSRPWNTTLPAVVVTSPSIQQRWLSMEDATPNESWRPERAADSDSADRPGAALDDSVAMARGPQGDPCGQVARKGGRILDSPVRRASGRGSSRGRPLLCV